MQKTVVFKEILMLPFSRHRIMHRTRRTRFIGKARATHKTDVQMKFSMPGFVARE